MRERERELSADYCRQKVDAKGFSTWVQYCWDGAIVRDIVSAGIHIARKRFCLGGIIRTH